MEAKLVVFGDNTEENNFGTPNKPVEVCVEDIKPSLTPSADYSMFGVHTQSDEEGDDDTCNSYQEKVSTVNAAFVEAHVNKPFIDTIPLDTPVSSTPGYNVDITTGEIIDDVALYEAEESYRKGEDYRSGTVVKMYGETQKLNYPHIHLESKDLPVFMVRTLKGMLNTAPTEGVDSLHVYLNAEGQLLEIGVLERKMLRSFLNNKVLGKLNATIRLSVESELVGDMMYAMCTLNS